MCGICGFVDFKSTSDKELLDTMISTLHHRGPDDRGGEIYNQNNVVVGLGQTRLSIIDLSPLGHQPMEYENYSIVYNGEIYNFEEIKEELYSLGHKFKSNSDTEVILHSFKEWGLNCVSKFIGMFVFVILDTKLNEVTIIRDRAGVKPLFYYWKDGLFMFSSELKAFHEHPRFVKKIDKKAVQQYMNYGHVPSPNCIFKDCSKLDAGHILKFSLKNKKYSITKYWDVTNFYKKPKLKISYQEAKDKVKSLLISSFNYRMVADVPVGVFLSGGIDSSIVTAILQKNRKEQLNTFTIGFEEGNNEAPHAKEIANYLGTNHKEYYCTTKEVQEIIKDLPFYFDEPFGDSSAIPTILVSKLAKEDVTVALSADGGDEIFAGYDLYKTFDKNYNFIKKIPSSLSKPICVLLKIAKYCIPGSRQGLKKKTGTIINVLSKKEKFKITELYNSYFVLGDNINKKLFRELESENMKKQPWSLDYLSFALSTDYKNYMQNDILTKVDRASMSVSLEGREPLLDHRIIEYVATLPNEFKFDGGGQKKILKDILYDFAPKKLFDRPKAGFSLPIDKWLKTDLNELLEEFLSAESIEKSNFFNFNYIEELKKKFYNGTLYDSSIIWKLIQFQMWYKKWML